MPCHITYITLCIFLRRIRVVELVEEAVQEVLSGRGFGIGLMGTQLKSGTAHMAFYPYRLELYWYEFAFNFDDYQLLKLYLY